MKIILTPLELDPEKICVFTEENYPKVIPDSWHEWVWQYAPDEETAIKQHDKKIDANEANPEKDTY